MGQRVFLITCTSSIILPLNPLTPNVKEQILLSCSHTFLICYIIFSVHICGEVIKRSRKFNLGDH